ncbi:hypothetical protein AYO21_00807 [Fonsecaea monophora]|uniref:Alpha/beta hydrolase fold-3 domain-containing protein n=1 Tax=Fonsecaea monophora TaxID=254056 RepID=A0A177FKV5_9EURO|nr:hypothetical protein AYO21_00807 [Fonsecaea monophora]KAH0844334.1 esterase [Fonsecaea pedrosoi]OAG44845.1 hypothetical protein AYO21_00807 [Fonsecaea monophora]
MTLPYTTDDGYHQKTHQELAVWGGQWAVQGIQQAENDRVKKRSLEENKRPQNLPTLAHTTTRNDRHVGKQDKMTGHRGPLDTLSVYKDISSRLMNTNAPLDLEGQRQQVGRLGDLATEPTEVTYEEEKVPGSNLPAIWVKPVHANPSQVILYFHGGGGFAGSPSSHRKLVGHLAKRAGCYGLVTDYALVPECPLPANRLDGLATWNWLTGEKGFAPNQIALGGDSAGGNVATGVALALKEQHQPLPAAVVAFSPWIDMENLGESLKSNADMDFLSPPGMADMAVAMYLGGTTSPKDPFANPLYADFTGMPPMNISAGGAETLRDDAVRLAEHVKKAGVETELEIVPNGQHVYHFAVGREPEATRTVEKVGDWLHAKLN